MRVCPKCNESYTDENLNFCLADGELLLETETQDAPPTVILDSARVTNDGQWGSGFDPGNSESKPTKRWESTDLPATRQSSDGNAPAKGEQGSNSSNGFDNFWCFISCSFALLLYGCFYWTDCSYHGFYWNE